ncbi:MAG: M48 family metallopeptidase [Snowella sp.]|nr:M48 family metallopeptidase [Snowella sp.]
MAVNRFRQRCISWAIAGMTTFSVVLTTAQPSYSQSWMQLFFQGIQVLQLSNLSDQQEVRLGQQINQQLVQQGQFRPSRNRSLNRYVNEIGQRLAQASERPDIPYTFQVVDDRAINAFATMGGYVYINTGTILAADNEAELASVIAHEIGHITARHAVTQMRDATLSQGLMSAAGLQESTIVRLGVQFAVNLPTSREDELEADSLGLNNLIRAGYAPIGMVNFMKKLQRQGNSGIEILSSHPDTANRVVALQEAINPNTANEGDGLDTQAYQTRISSRR